MKEYRHAKCPYCSTKLRLTITEKNYGKRILVTCREEGGGCGGKFGTTIPTPATKRETREQKIARELQELVNKARNTEFNPEDMLFGSKPK